MNNIIKTDIRITDIKQGMIIEHNNEFYTVCKNDVKYCEFLGYSFKGNSSKKVLKRIQFKVPILNGYRIE